MAGKKTSAKKTSGKKSKKVVDTTPVVTEPTETVEVDTTVNVVSEVTPPVVEDNYDSEFTEINEKLKSALSLIKELTTHVSRLEKRVVRDRKVMNKKMKGRVKRTVDPNKPPSGFAKPGPISDELRKFLGLEDGVLVARTEVTKMITAYCKEHNLQMEEDKRNINPDTALKKLLRLKSGDSLTFFNLQKYMKVHYPGVGVSS